MLWHKWTGSLLLGVFLLFPTSGRGHVPDIQGRPPLSIDEAIKASKDPNPETRSFAAESVAQLGPGANKAVPFLLHLLKTDVDDDVRAEAARALGRIGKVEGVLPTLQAALKHKNLRVAVNAAEAIGLLGEAYEAEGVAFLIQALRQSYDNHSGSPPEFVFGALSQLGCRARAAGPVLLPLLRNRQPWVRLNVLLTLEAIEDDRDALIVPMITVIMDRNLAGYLSPIGETAEVLVRPLLTGRFDDPEAALIQCLASFRGVAGVNRGCRETAMRILARIGPKAKAALPPLTECLKDKQLHDEAEKALASIRGRR